MITLRRPLLKEKQPDQRLTTAVVGQMASDLLAAHGYERLADKVGEAFAKAIADAPIVNPTYVKEQS